MFALYTHLGRWAAVLVGALLLCGGQAERLRAQSLPATEPQAAAEQALAHGDTSAALDAFARGLKARAAADQRDVLLASAYLGVLFEAGLEGHLDAAARAYRRVLKATGRSLTREEREAVAPVLARLALLLPERLQAGVLAEGAWRQAPAQWRLAPQAGRTLLAWWRRQDPLPATGGNERLYEHLRRVAHARQRYGWGERTTGLDDRGETYVKYGAPAERTTVEFEDPGTALMTSAAAGGRAQQRRLRSDGGTKELRNSSNEQSAQRSVPSIPKIPSLAELRGALTGTSLSAFPPPNEAWWYRDIDEEGYYLFVEKGGHFQIGGVAELVPPRLRTPLPERGGRAAAGYQIMRSIYMQLAREDVDFARRLDKLNGYLSDTRKPRLSVFVRSNVADSRVEDRRAARRREQAMPRQSTDATEDVPALPVAVRTARFLDEDGATRTEVYWRPRPGALRKAAEYRVQNAGGGIPLDEYLARLTVVQRGPSRRVRARTATTYVIDRTLDKSSDEAMVFQTDGLSGQAQFYHLGLQWDLYAAKRRPGKRILRSPLLKRATRQLDSLTTLSSDRRTLVMSDLRPMLVRPREAAGLPRGKPLRDKTRQWAYPFEKIRQGAPLALYFEVYHLGYGAEDQGGEDRTRYTVEYEVQRRTEEGGFRGLLGGDEEERTATKTTYEGTKETARKLILLDLSEAEEGGSEIRVTVRVTDQVIGQTRERSVYFETLPAP